MQSIWHKAYIGDRAGAGRRPCSSRWRCYSSCWQAAWSTRSCTGCPPHANSHDYLVLLPLGVVQAPMLSAQAIGNVEKCLSAYRDASSHLGLMVLRLDMLCMHRNKGEQCLHTIQCWHGSTNNSCTSAATFSSSSAPSVHSTSMLWRQIAGWVGLWVGLVAFYAATAILTAEVWEREWLPIGHMLKGPMPKKTCAASLLTPAFVCAPACL